MGIEQPFRKVHVVEEGQERTLAPEEIEDAEKGLTDPETILERITRKGAIDAAVDRGIAGLPNDRNGLERMATELKQELGQHGFLAGNPELIQEVALQAVRERTLARNSQYAEAKRNMDSLDDPNAAKPLNPEPYRQQWQATISAAEEQADLYAQMAREYIERN
jgi:hypothetical protein